MATLALKDGFRTKVWRVAREQIKADPVYATAGVAVVMADDPDRESTTSLDSYQGPTLRFTPGMGPSGTMFTEASNKAMLVVTVEAMLPNPDLEDLFNLQEAIESTLNPLDTTLEAGIVDAGGITGMVLHVTPLKVVNDQQAKDRGMVRAVGQFQIEVERPFTNP